MQAVEKELGIKTSTYQDLDVRWKQDGHNNVYTTEVVDSPLCTREAWLSQQIPGMFESHQVVIKAQRNICTGR